MNVNKKEVKRIRRTPDEARSLILKAAAARLAEFGLEGLNISGVAKDAGMSHGTVIHHFGSTGAMRKALLAQMTTELLADVIQALAHHEPAEKVLERLFKMLSKDGHGKLLAWLAMDQQVGNMDLQASSTKHLFADIIKAITEHTGSQSVARQQVLLVAAAALGLGICGDALTNLIGLSADETEDFPGWLASQLLG